MTEDERSLSEPFELDVLVGALDLIGRLKRIERAVGMLSDAIANLQIMVTAEALARIQAADARQIPIQTITSTPFTGNPSVYIPHFGGNVC